MKWNKRIYISSKCLGRNPSGRRLVLESGCRAKRQTAMKWNKKFIYPKSSRSLIEGKRHYDIDDSGQQKLPSVTTILSATQSEEKKASLAAWKARLGDTAADRVRDTAALTGHSNAHVSGRLYSGNRAQGPDERGPGS